MYLMRELAVFVVCLEVGLEYGGGSPLGEVLASEDLTSIPSPLGVSCAGFDGGGVVLDP